MAAVPSSWMHDDYKDFLVALETNYGDPTGLTFIPCRGWDYSETWLEADEKELAYAVPYGGSKDFDLLKKRASISFKIGLVSYGDAATGIPPWHPLVLACRTQAVTVAPTAVNTIAATATAGAGATGAFTYTRTTAFGQAVERTVTLTCTTAGGDGVATFTVAAPEVDCAAAYEVTGVVMTVGEVFALPGGAEITIDAIGSDFVLDDAYTITLTAAGTTYRPLSAPQSHKSCNIRCFMDDPSLDTGHKRLYQLNGCRGNAKIMGADSDYPYIEISLTCLFTLPVDSDAPPADVDYTAWPDPVEVSTENTPVWSLFGLAQIGESFEMDFGVDVKFTSRVGRREARAEDHKATMKMKVEEPGLNEWNIMADVVAKTNGAMVIQHGDTAGNTIRITAPRVQLSAPRKSTSDKTVMAELSGKLKPSAADNDWTIFAA